MPFTDTVTFCTPPSIAGAASTASAPISSTPTSGTCSTASGSTATGSGAASGSAYVFDVRLGTQQLELVPSDGAPGDQFGTAVAVDGPYVVVGAPLFLGLVFTDSVYPVFRPQIPLRQCNSGSF